METLIEPTSDSYISTDEASLYIPGDIYPPSLLENIKHVLPDGYKLRPLKVTDLDNGLVELLSQLTVVGKVSAEQLFARYTSMALTNPQTYYLTVIEDINAQKIVAAATLVIELKFIHQAGSRGRIEDVVVDKEKRGLGFAKILNETLVALAKNIGVYKLSLECKDNLIPFYEKFGYKKDEGNNFLVQRFD